MLAQSRAILASVAILLAAPSLAGAQVLWDRSDDLPDFDAGLFIHGSNVLASQFSFLSPGTVGSVRFWGSEYLGWEDPGAVNWWIYTSNLDGDNPAPLGLVASGTSSTSRQFVGSQGDYTTHEYAFSVSPQSLSSGLFWLALNVDAPGSPGGFTWDMGQFQNDTHVLHTATGDFADSPGALHLSTARFQLMAATTVTPEPVTTALLASGLLGIGAARRRRRKRED